MLHRVITPAPVAGGRGFPDNTGPTTPGPDRRGQSLTEREVRDFRRERITHCKVPDYIPLVDDYPVTVTGKIQKFDMR